LNQGPPQTLLAAAAGVLRAGAPDEKAAAALQAGALAGAGAALGSTPPGLALRPARPEKPELKAPGQVPRRRLGTPAGRAALLHAIAHIEFNAIDLAFDMAARFSEEIEELGLDGRQFAQDWIGVGVEEARHFGLIAKRLTGLDCRYGDFPAHNGLWEAAEKTAHDVLARLAIAPLILEARGLDVTPEMIERLRGAGDGESVAALEVIYAEEVGHVACGKRWYDAVCMARRLDPEETFQRMRRKFFAGQLKPPFNHSARARAGLPRGFYEPNGKENRSR